MTKLKLEATEKYNLKCRLKEEEVLLVKEMKSYLLFNQQMILSLEEDIQGTLCMMLYTFVIIALVTEANLVNVLGKFLC